MGKRGKSAQKAARAARAAARRAAEEELRAAVEREGDERRQAAYSVAKDFVKLFMPRAERMGAFCVLLKSRDILRRAKRYTATTVMYEYVFSILARSLILTVPTLNSSAICVRLIVLVLELTNNYPGCGCLLTNQRFCQQQQISSTLYCIHTLILNTLYPITL